MSFYNGTKILERGNRVEKKIVIDTNVYLGIFFGNNSLCMSLHDYLIDNDSHWIIVMCKTILEEIHRNLGKGHGFANLFQQHVIRQYVIKNRFLFGEEKELPKDCNVSHKNDAHLIRCACGSNCKILITLDDDLELSDECQVKKYKVKEFIEKMCNSKNS